MSSLAISLIICVFVFGGTLLGYALRAVLPDQHLTSDSKDAVKLGMGLVATMVALVLGLLVASAKSSYDMQASELTEMSSKTVLLDRVLAHYGPETKEARDSCEARLPEFSIRCGLRSALTVPKWSPLLRAPKVFTIRYCRYLRRTMPNG